MTDQLMKQTKQELVWMVRELEKDRARLTYIIEETCLLHKDYLSEWVIDEAFTLRDNDAEDEGVADQAMVRALIDQHMKESK